MWHCTIASLPVFFDRLETAGYGIGVRFLELVAFKERSGKRETGVIGILQFVSGPLWQQLFGKPADALEKSVSRAFCDSAGRLVSFVFAL